MNHIAKRTISALSVAAAVVLAILFAPPVCFPPAFALIYIFALVEYCQLLKRKVSFCSVRGISWLIAGSVLLALPFAALPFIALTRGSIWMLYLIFIVKLSDMGGFALGMAFGRHKLCPTISPNKSWEGLFGSLLASTLISLAFIGVTRFPCWKAVVFGIIAALVGTFGDLVESKFKRWVEVKDSSTFLPAGMGGVLDTFDSLLFAPAILALLIETI